VPRANASERVRTSVAASGATRESLRARYRPYQETSQTWFRGETADPRGTNARANTGKSRHRRHRLTPGWVVAVLGVTEHRALGKLLHHPSGPDAQIDRRQDEYEPERHAGAATHDHWEPLVGDAKTAL
jgi:hypothetical protein